MCLVAGVEDKRTLFSSNLTLGNAYNNVSYFVPYITAYLHYGSFVLEAMPLIVQTVFLCSGIM